MAKLRSLLAAALLTVAAASLSAGPASSVDDRGALNPSRPVADMCWIIVNGKWWQVPC